MNGVIGMLDSVRSRWRQFEAEYLSESHRALARELLSGALAVAVVGLILFAISGLWPPMYAVESPSMAPNMHESDLVFAMDEDRLEPDAAYGETGVVTYRGGKHEGYRTFGSHGDVIIFYRNGDPGETPIIHRARFWVTESENWVETANESIVSGRSCAEVRHCPAPHAGFVTKGDNNPTYDQIRGISAPVKPEWVIGTSEVRIPFLGGIRLLVPLSAGLPV